MWYSNKLGRAAAGLLAGLALACGLAACTSTPSNIGVGLPTVDANSGVYLLDTLTVRASTVLRDSVVTSTSSYLLVGRARDPQLGIVQATSFCVPQLPYAFSPASTAVFDSITLRLIVDNGTYRYGDTTKLQSLVNVYPLTTTLPASVPLFASKKYTPLDNYYAPPSTATLLNKKDASGVPTPPRRRASPKLTSIRVPLSADLGNRLMTAGKAGRLLTQEDFLAILPGLVLAPASTDEGALVRLLANSTEAGIALFYHDPADPTTAQSFTALLSGGRHVFQVEADRTGTAFQNLPTASLGKVDASLTGQQTVIEGGIGYQTRLEFPYLNNVRDLGRRLTITGAQVTAEVPPATLSPQVPAPATLVVSTSNANNQPTSVYLSTLSYVTGTSSLTALDQGSYSFALTTYVNAVLAGIVPNNGLLLASSTPELPSRVILGGPRNASNKLRLRLYVINSD